MSKYTTIETEHLKTLLKLAEDQWELNKTRKFVENRSVVKEALAAGHTSLQRPFPSN